ncbi:hypothetical protein [Deinococcus cellulosilyticus]|uniref:Uncharacterized protein n=1 Tax=Deinococcus cellulosilyticus (strain DSM 18568 / NBRC 106333 / KACC 11606 / 5516J-15) TaxID=1223518 RepID=A0A511N825_DEIC1|nr:hypothetical protein [Deinococcus cellulosilyticus]GEM48638.1 hypothetical protein DC3_42730 [Deinococcus cellulosilyticus NBRC 106333 = KACC 11606]
MILIVEAYDPGPEKTAFAVLAAGARDALELVDTGVLPSWGSELQGRILGKEGGLIAIEGVANYLASKARASTLFKTCEVVGRLKALAEVAGFEPYVLPANAPFGKPHWRYNLTGREGAGDAAVKTALKLLFGKAALVGRTNHELDALGLAVVAARVNWRKFHAIEKR